MRKFNPTLVEWRQYDNDLAKAEAGENSTRVNPFVQMYKLMAGDRKCVTSPDFDLAAPLRLPLCHYLFVVTVLAHRKTQPFARGKRRVHSFV